MTTPTTRSLRHRATVNMLRMGHRAPSIAQIATIPVLVGFGAASSVAIQGIVQNSTPWAGAFERINAYAYFAWLIVLAVIVTRRSLQRGGRHADLENEHTRSDRVGYIVQERRLPA